MLSVYRSWHRFSKGFHRTLITVPEPLDTHLAAQ
jgi:hypothetical protein